MENHTIEHQKQFFSLHKTKPIQFRIQQLKNLKAAILKYEDRIYEALYKDLGKSKIEAYSTEVGFVLHELSHHIKHLKSWAKNKRARSYWLFPLSKSFIKSEPLGVVLIISPWNYPFNLTLSPLLGAISAGNCVTIKPSEISNNTSAVMQELLESVFPKDYVQVIQGGAETSQHLLKQKFDYIFFTGSEFVGKIVMKAAAENLTPLTLELGGKSPCVVDKTCNLEKTATRIVYGKFLNVGQTCIAPDYLLIHEDVKQQLVEKIKEKTTKFFSKNASESQYFGKIINDKHFQRLTNYLSEVNIVSGGKSDLSKLFIEPTLVDNAENAKIMQDEIFGPILPIVTFKKTEEAVQFINNRPKPLALYIFSSDKQFEKTILNKTSSGGACVNDAIIQIANTNLPFGGVGNSGFGKYHGKASFDTFSNAKSVLKNTNLFDIPHRFPPFSPNSLKMIKRLMK